MNVVVVRHAQTLENARGLIQGHSRGSLTALGKQQAEKAALLLKEEAFDVIYSSDLERCVDTTQYIATYHPETPLCYDSALREIHVGKLDRVPVPIPRFATKVGAWLMKRFKFKLPGGESLQSLQKRVETILNEIYKRYPDGTILIVTHSVTMRAIAIALDKTKDIDSTSIPNCAIWRRMMPAELEP